MSAAARPNRSGSLTRRLSSGIAARGIAARANRPRQLRAAPASPRTTAIIPVPTPHPAVTSAMPLVRSLLRVSSAAITPLTEFVADSSGRPRANRATNHQ